MTTDAIETAYYIVNDVTPNYGTVVHAFETFEAAASKLKVLGAGRLDLDLVQGEAGLEIGARVMFGREVKKRVGGKGQARTFIADYYTCPDAWMVAAAKAADEGDGELADAWQDVIEATVMHEDGVGGEAAVDAALSNLRAVAGERVPEAFEDEDEDA